MILLAVFHVGGPVAVTLATLLAGERLVVAGLAGVLQQRVPLQQPRRRERRQADAAATRESGQPGEAAVPEDATTAGASARPLHQRAPSARFQSEGERDLRDREKNYVARLPAPRFIAIAIIIRAIPPKLGINSE